MSTRTVSLSPPYTTLKNVTKDSSPDTGFVIRYQVLSQNNATCIEPELRGKLLYVVRGVGELLNQEGGRIRSIRCGRVFYLPHNLSYKIRNQGSEVMKYLVVAQARPNDRERNCSLVEPCLLFRYFREGCEYYEDGGIFLRNHFNPQLTALQLPVTMSDLSLAPGEKTRRNISDRSICHIILEGEAEMSFKGRKPVHLQESERLFIPKGTAWKIKNTGMKELSVATLYNSVG